MDNEIDRKIDVTAIQSLFVQNRQLKHDWTLIGSGANGISLQVWSCLNAKMRMPGLPWKALSDQVWLRYERL